MQRYNQYCPVARATEILGDRWTTLIVRELINGSRRFNEIERGLPGISRSLLSTRLRDLQLAGVVEKSETEYHLTEAGREARSIIEAFGAWGVRWAFGEPDPEELDAGLLVWKIHQRINRDALPEKRTIVEFDFSGPHAQRVWLLLERSEVSVCITPPRFEPDLIVRSDLAYFFRVWYAQVDFTSALRCGAIRIEGPRALAQQLPRWFLWSPMARFVREAAAAGR